MEESVKKVKSLVRRYFMARKKEEFVPGKTKIPLSIPSYNWEEANEAIESLLSTWVTMGRKVETFERLFAQYTGVRNAVMVNSGSSANLLVLSVLTNPMTKDRIKKDEEIITPSVTWATTVYPIINVNAVPVLVDVDLETYNIDPSEIEEAITEKTRAIMPVHLLGNPCEMERIMKAAELDKKTLMGKIRFVLLKSIGNAFITDEVSLSLIEEVLVGWNEET